MDVLNDILYSSPIRFETIAFRLLFATLLSGAIGFERGFRGRAAGLRTHILVCIGSALTVMVGIYASENLGFAGVDPLRIAAQVVSGIGFLGAGTIFMSEHKISGLTTAASLWCMACIGLAVGSGFILMGCLAGLIVLVVLKMMQRVIHVHTLKKLEVQFIHSPATLAFLSEYFTKLGVKILDVDFHAETKQEGNLYTNMYTLTMPSRISYVDIIEPLSEHPNIRRVRTRNL